MVNFIQHSRQRLHGLLTLLMLMPISLCAATYVPQKPKQYGFSKITYAVKYILQDLGLVFGIGMVVVGIYQYFEHRSNPLANPLGKVVTLILAGSALIGVYFLPMPDIKGVV